MVATRLDELKWELLLDRIHDRRCIPFLGAGVNVSNVERNYAGLLLGGDVAKLLADELRYAKRSKHQLSRVALEYQLRTDRPRLVERLRRSLADEHLDPSFVVETLAPLPLRLIVTTNYDRLLERAMERRDTRVVVQTPDGFADTPENRAWFDDLNLFDGVVIYKIHGSFIGPGPSASGLDENDESVVIVTEDDYIDFLTIHQSDQGQLGVPKFIQARIAPSTLLFLGYGLEDWDFRTIHRALVQNLPKNQQRVSIAIQRKPAPYWVKYWESLGVGIYDIDLYEFCADLRERYKARHPGDINLEWLAPE